ncbi:MAG: NADH-quinone oxidoreductase subunit M [Rickettsiales bacterium]
MGDQYMHIDFLTLLCLLPVAGAFFIGFFVREGSDLYAERVHQTALWISLGTFLFSCLLLFGFSDNASGYKFVKSYILVKSLAVRYSVGVDGVSALFILLTAFLTPIALAAGKQAIVKRVKEYAIAFLALEALVIGVFISTDIFTFYVFFEAALIPMYVIIGIWGGENRIYAAYKFFIYTLAGSVLFLLAALYLRTTLGTSSIPELTALAGHISPEAQQWLFLAFFASFAVKVPMFPFHTWLPDAHVQAPTGGSVMLAGILLKLGGYGLFRFSLPILPDASRYFADAMNVLSVIAIIYGSLVALAQTDMKKLIAYSSVAHMGFVTLGLFSFTKQGIDGAVMVMVSHGLVSAALFLCVGVLYDRMHTKEIAKYGGVANVMPVFAALFLFFSMASAGLPGTSSFVGEFLTILGAFKAAPHYAALSVSGVVLGAAYILYLYKRVMFGEVPNPEIAALPDVRLYEAAMLSALAFFTLLIGIYPAVVTNYAGRPSQDLLQIYRAGTLRLPAPPSAYQP